MKIRCFEENDIKPIYELLKNELGYEVDYSLFVLRVQEMIKNNYLIYVACIENKVAAITLNSGISRKTAHIFYEKQGYSKKGYSFVKYLK